MTGPEPVPEPPRTTVAGTAGTLLAGQLSVYAVGFLASVLIARAVGPQGRGEYYLPVLAAALAQALTNFSVEHSSIVTLADAQESLARLTRSAASIALVVGPLAAAGTLGAYFLLRGSVFEDVSLLDMLIVVPTIPVGLHLLWLTGIYVLAKRVRRSQLALVVGAAAQLLGAAVLYATGHLTVPAVLVLYDVSIVLPWLLLLWWARDFTEVRPLRERDLPRRLLALGARMQVGLFFMFLLLRFDVFLVSVYLGADAVGVYSLAVLFAELAWLITDPIGKAAVPFQVELPARESARLVFKASRFNFALATALAAFMAATLWALIPALYGHGFSGSYDALVLLLPGIMAVAIARPLTVLLLRQGRPLLYSAMSALAFLLNCGLNVLLIPRIGILGASVASTCSYVALACAYVFWALRAGGLTPREALAWSAADRETVKGVLRRLRPAGHSAA